MDSAEQNLIELKAMLPSHFGGKQRGEETEKRDDKIYTI